MIGPLGRLTLLTSTVGLIIWLHGYIGPLSMMIALWQPQGTHFWVEGSSFFLSTLSFQCF
jgi:hypothetical protein